MRGKRSHGWSHQRRSGRLIAGLALLLALAPAIAHSQTDTLVLVWTAPGDDGSVGQATGYEVRVSTAPITDANWSSATPVGDLPSPQTSGSRQRVTVRGLTRGTTYWFGLKSADDAGNVSALSNVLRWDWVFDTAPPAAPTGLTVVEEGTGASLNWTANGEPDLAGYTVYRATSASGPWIAISNGLVATNSYLDDPLPTGATVFWYRVSASDGSGNESARSAAVSLDLSDAVATAWALQAAYPNPSRGADPVSIPVVIPAGGASSAELHILDSGRRLVRRLALGALGTGNQTVTWDGRNDAGRPVAPGVYTAWVVAGDRRASTKLVRVP